MKLIGNGAEARIYLDAKKNCVVKRRIQKTYRVDEIDSKMRLQRTRREAKILNKLSEICPSLINVDEKSMEISMEYIDGPMVKDVVDDMEKNERTKVMHAVGVNTGKMHQKDVIHGDLTTSNMLLLGNEVKFIDFGLAFVTNKIEHKAVDIHLMKHALESKHYRNYESLFESFLEGYKEGNPEYNLVMDRLEIVEKRGRYKRRMGS
jgi:Kae1-associated kinase Bud32